MPTRAESFFQGTQATLLAEFAKSGGIKHSGEKGFARDMFVRGFLKSSFPSKYVFSRGEIIDSLDTVSPQCDVVVYDEAMPVLFHAGTDQFFAEGVLSHIEVKSTLDGAGLIEDLDKCAKVGSMTLSINELMHFGEPRKSIPSFMVGFQGLTAANFKAAVLAYREANSAATLPRVIAILDPGLVCVIEGEDFKFGETGQDTLAAIFIHLTRAMWKHWAAVPDFGEYLGEGKFNSF